jgi:hypothetical protein
MAQMQRPSSKGLTPAQRAARSAADKKAYEKYLATRTPSKGLTPEQRAARTAANAKAAEAYRKSRPSKEQVMKARERQAAEAAANQKIVDRINAETRANAQRTNRSKTVAPKPAVKRPGSTPAPLGTPAPRTQRGTPAPLGTPAPRSSGRRPTMPKTTKKAPAKPIKKQEKMTPQDAAMKKILEGKYGKIYG